MQLTGIAYRGPFGATQGVDPATWLVPATVDVYIGVQPVGSAALTQDVDGTVNVVATIDDIYKRWTQTRRYLNVTLGGVDADTVDAISIDTSSPDPDQPQWADTTP